MSLGTVCALVGAQGREDLEADTRAAASECGAATAPDVAAALASGAEWVWLLDGLTVPRPGALVAFGDAVVRLAGLPAPVILASRVLADSGELHPDAAPRHEIFEKELTVAAVERGLVQLRAVPSGSVLVRRDVLGRLGAPRADLPPSWAVFELTARALRSHADPGFLVPDSVAVRRVPARPTAWRSGDARSRTRLLAGPAWNATERLWEAFLVGDAALRAARAPARRGAARRAAPAR